MGIEVLVGSAMALLFPAAKRIAGKTGEQFLADVSEDAYEKAGQFLSWLKERWAGNRKGERAIEDLEADPDDRTYQQALKVRLTEAAESDSAFKEELEKHLAESGPAVNVFISLDEMEDVTGLKAKTVASGAVNVQIVGGKGKKIVGAEIDQLGTPPDGR